MKKKTVIMSAPTEEDRIALRLLVRTRVDFQSIRKAMDNRIGRKADGEAQDLKEERKLSPEYIARFARVSNTCNEQEEYIEKLLIKILQKFPIYNEFLAKVKGVGPIASGWIIGEFDIHRATTISKMWQFAGLNPGMVRGHKRHETENGKYTIDITDTLVRGDKLTPGFVAPFNRRLRTALVGVMATVFIKSQNDYAMSHYYPYKTRLSESQREVEEIKKGGKKVILAWSDATKSHRDRAAQRKMIKEFLKDLYVAWRTLEGLPVREPYSEEYLGRKHDINHDDAKMAEKTIADERSTKVEHTTHHEIASDPEKPMDNERAIKPEKTKTRERAT